MLIATTHIAFSVLCMATFGFESNVISTSLLAKDEQQVMVSSSAVKSLEEERIVAATLVAVANSCLSCSICKEPVRASCLDRQQWHTSGSKKESWTVKSVICHIICTKKDGLLECQLDLNNIAMAAFGLPE